MIKAEVAQTEIIVLQNLQRMLHHVRQQKFLLLTSYSMYNLKLLICCLIPFRLLYTDVFIMLISVVLGKNRKKLLQPTS